MNIRKLFAVLLATFTLLWITACDSDIKKFTKKMNDDRMTAFLENSEKEQIHTSDSVRNLVGEYSKNLPIRFPDGIEMIGLDTVTVKRNVWCKTYFRNINNLDSTLFSNKIDSILTYSEPFKGWLKYGDYSMNVEFWCYQISKGDTIRISTIKPLRYRK